MTVTAQTLFIEPCPSVLPVCFIELNRDGMSLITEGFEDTGRRIGQNPVLNRFSERPFRIRHGHQGTRECLRGE
jgi:hypothetical protein